MKKALIYFTLGLLLLGSATVFNACQKEKMIEQEEQALTLGAPAKEELSGPELVAFYEKAIADRQKAGSSVVFQDGSSFVENPDREWLEKKFGAKGNAEKDHHCEYCFWFEYQASVPTSSANVDFFDDPSGNFLWNLSVTHPAAGWPAGTWFVSNEHCTEDPPECFSVEWDMATVDGKPGKCSLLNVRVRRPSGNTQGMATSGYPIPSQNNDLGPLCPVREDCLPTDFCPNACNCTYEIVRFDVQNIENQPFELSLFSGEGCVSPGCGQVLNGLYFSGPNCGPGPSACVDYWNNMPTPGTFNFNCPIAPNSQLHLTAYGNLYDPLSCFGLLTPVNWSITYRITCRPDGASGCDVIPDSHFSTEVTITNPAWPLQSSTDIIRMTGCGCQPALDEECANQIPDVIISCTQNMPGLGYRGFCLTDVNGNILSQSPTVLSNASVYWHAPSQFDCFQGQCATPDNGPPLPYPQNGEIMSFTVRIGNCFRDFNIPFNCN